MQKDNQNTDIIIIGAGLSGLVCAYLLTKNNIDFKILEARNRPGGRINTINADMNQPLELGATWFGLKHKHVLALINELDIESFKQNFGKQAIFEPLSTSPPYVAALNEANEHSYRIKGGTIEIINKLISKVGSEKIEYASDVTKIIRHQKNVSVFTNHKEYIGGKIISPLPPKLLTSTIDFEPALPFEFIQTCESTHTWMADSIKVGLSFKSPFWQNEKSSGTIVSNVGPIPEMYEHNNHEDNFYALVGFLNGSYHLYSREQRKDLVIKQLSKYYGAIVDEHIEYFEKVWRHESKTFSPYITHVVPHQNNGHSFYRNALFDNSLFLAGAETAIQFPGYMDGAISSAHHVINMILEN